MDANKKIFVVDDEPDLAEMVSFQFEKKGFEVQSAKDGVDALSKVHEFKPDLIILDMNMPRMGGIEFYSKICGSDGKPRYPVLVLTARANVEGLFKDLEIEGFMIKPFDIEHLVQEAETIIKKRSKAGAKIKSRNMHKICVADNNRESFDQLAGTFLLAGYSVIPAQTGAMAIERMMEDAPDVALVSLGLVDIPGDIVIYRLSQMAKTMDVKFILYTHRTAEHDRQVMERIATKTGIFTFVEYNEAKELLEKVKQIE